MIRGTYRPPSPQHKREPDLGPVERFLSQVREVGLTTDELLGHYYALALDRFSGSFTEAGRRLDVDPRVIKRRHNPNFLERITPRADCAGGRDR
jgi:hypothetical protein